MTHLTYRKDIDGLRAIAVLSVVLFHAFPNYLPGGFVGVDIFFVISGYLISGILYREHQEGTFSYSNFYARRIKRIFPALLLVLIASYAFGWFQLMAVDYAQLGKHIAAGAGFISNFVFWSESGYFDADAIRKPLLHLWSLGIEEQFYILWPIMLSVLFIRIRLIKAALIGLFISSLASSLYLTHEHPVAAFYAPWARFWELLLGAGLAFQTMNSSPHSDAKQAVNKLYQECLAWFGLSLIILACLCFTSHDSFPGWRALIPTVGAASLIASGPDTRCHRLILNQPLAVGLGLISYPLYLWHWPILSFAAHYFGAEISGPEIAILMLVAIVLAYLTYQFIEKRIRYKNDNFLNRIKPPILITLMVIIGFVGWNCYQRDGIEMRHRDFLKQISSYQYDKVKEQRQHVCFLLDETDDVSHFEKDCISKKKGFHIVLWGDSHGGALSPGFRKLEENSTNVAFTQFTIAGCGGQLDQVNKPTTKQSFCERANQKALSLIFQIKPNVVVLHKGWGEDLAADQQIIMTIAKQLNQANIELLVMGPVPTWKEDLPGFIYRYWKGNHQLPSAYGKEFLTDYVPDLDHNLEVFTKHQSIKYFSAYQSLCDERGCKRYWPESGNAMTAYDKSHISPVPATFLVEQLTKKFWPTINTSTLNSIKRD